MLRPHVFHHSVFRGPVVRRSVFGRHGFQIPAFVLLSLGMLCVTPANAESPAPDAKKAVEGARDARNKADRAVGQAHDARDKAHAARDEAREARDEAKDARETAKDAREEAREDRKEARESRRELRKDQLEKLGLRLKELEKNRKERRDKYRDAIEKRWGALVSVAPVRAELVRHAWRMARLNRMHDLAEALEDKPLLARIDALLKRENERHERRMTALKENPNPTPAGSGLAAVHGAPGPSGASPAPSAAPAGSAQ
jgi:hypothetical protein